MTFDFNPFIHTFINAHLAMLRDTKAKDAKENASPNEYVYNILYLHVMILEIC